MKTRIGIWTFFLTVLLFSYALFSPLKATDTASLLPNGVQQFFDNNGNPLTSGKVYFYEVGTTTFKTTWKNSTETLANTNPVVLDAGGKAVIYGFGTYRQIVKDRNGNLIWDAVTAPGGGGGSTPTDVGDGNLVGTVLPWSGLVAPNQYLFAYGQEISRTAYPIFYTAITQQLNVICSASSNILTGISDTSQVKVGSPIELSLCVVAGTTVTAKTAATITLSNPSSVSINSVATFFPWGNGDGSATFNVPDFRGYVMAGRDNMGGTAAARLSTTYFNPGGTSNPDALGAAGGTQSHTQTISEMAQHYHDLNDPGHTHVEKYNATGSATSVAIGPAATTATPTNSINSTASATTGITMSNQGASTAFSIVQPTITINYVVKVTPDTSTSIATGVYSIGGMTGVISCSTGISCTGNYISAFLVPGGSDKQVQFNDNNSLNGSANFTFISPDTLTLGAAGKTGIFKLINTTASSNVTFTTTGDGKLNLTDFAGTKLNQILFGGQPYITTQYISGNSYFGASAGNLTGGGLYNTGIGNSSLQTLTTGGFNTALGFQAGNNITTGNYNIAIGQTALVALTTGGSNTAIGGYGALSSMTTGSNNMGIGVQAGAAVTTGIENILIGNYAGLHLTTGTENVAIGHQSGTALTTGAQNTILGNGGSALTTGQSNVIIGYSTSQTITNANFTTAVGTGALRNNTASNNTAFGYSALFANTIGTLNTAVGYQALVANTNGISNTAVGDSTLLTNAGGQSNTAVGYQALNKNLNASNNTAIGSQSLPNSTGGENTAVGYASLLGTTTGAGNVAIGVDTGLNVTTGSQNTLLGWTTGYGLTTGQYNIMVGAGIGASGNGITTGSYNTIIGSQIAGLSAALSNNIILADGQGQIRTQFDNSTSTWIISNNTLLYTSGTYGFTNSTKIGAPGDGRLLLTNSAGTDFARLQLGGTSASFPAIKRNGTGLRFVLADDSNDAGILASTIGGSSYVQAYSGTAIPAGGTAGSGFLLSSTSNFGTFFGSGVPTLSAAQGSLYLRSDGAAATRLYVNNNGSTGWDAIGTAAGTAITSLTGDVTGTGPGATATTVASNAVTNAKLAQGGAASFKGNPTAATANISDFTLSALSNLASPSATLDLIPIWDHTAGTIKNVTPGAIAGSVVAGVSSVNTLTGALTIVGSSGIVVNSGGTAITITPDTATAANFEAGTAAKLLDANVVFTSEVTTTYGTTTAFDFNTFINSKVTLTGNITTMNCTNMKQGQAGTIAFIQDGTGSRTAAFNTGTCSTVLKFASATFPTLTTSASAVDILSYSCRSSSYCAAGLSKGYNP